MRQVIPIPVRQALCAVACLAVSTATFLMGLAMAGQVLAAEPAAAPTRVAPQLSPDLPQELRREVEAILRASPVRGAAIVVVDANGPTGAHWYGMADAARELPVTAATCMRVGAVSKTFTALLAQRLADQGKVALEAALPAELQPPAPTGGGRCAAGVSMVQLLEQTGGVVDHAVSTEMTTRIYAAAFHFVRQPLAWCPGLHHVASDASIGLAAAALERAGGADFDTLMRREVFVPLGVPDASFEGRPACQSRSYDLAGDVVPQPSASSLRPAGALIATPLELARLVQMFLRYGEGSAGNVVEPCGIAHMAIGTTALAGRQGAAAGAPGRGLLRFVAADRLLLGQTGRIGGFRTTIGFAPDAGKGMVIMLNTDDAATLKRLTDAVAARLWQGLPMPPLPNIESPAANIAGWYKRVSSERGRWVTGLDVLRIEQDEGGLTLRGLWPWSTPRRVLGVTPTAFRDEALPLASMAFAPASLETEGVRWWVDGESYRELAPALVWGWLVIGAMLLALAAAVGISGIALAGRWLVRRIDLDVDEPIRLFG